MAIDDEEAIIWCKVIVPIRHTTQVLCSPVVHILREGQAGGRGARKDTLEAMSLEHSLLKNARDLRTCG
ncbi:hypothetical protein DPEC_G00038540 [Dallia pectoralis]|uniref:Uncharacterized protein n=1 Tax=Dallia pectoralis TaxID=75939 RepID=A0ACC2HEK6_DALPE|nr:hypothetical protein DPEC_G00038540 [Dallia pectoralis]